MIVINGRPVSKKNSRKVYRNRKTGKIFFTPSDAYERFKIDALWQLKTVKDKYQGDIAVNYVFYQKGKLSQDFDNAIGSINDILQESGIIENDKYIKAGSFMVLPDCADWKTEIVIDRYEKETS